jgi:muramidase (phage lysozyme)/uncharacterized membrane protein YgcG
MSLGKDVLKEFVVSVAFELNKGLQQQIVKGVDEVTSAVKRQGLEEKRTTEQSKQFLRERAQVIRQFGEEVSGNLNRTLGTSFSKLSFQVSAFVAAFSSIRAVKRDLDFLGDLAKTANLLGTTPATFLPLKNSLKDAGDAIAAIQSRIRQNPGFKTFLRDSLGVTDFSDYSKTVEQIGTRLREIARTNQTLAFQFGQMAGLSEQQIATLIRPDFNQRLEHNRKIIETFGGDLNKIANNVKNANKAWQEFGERFQGITHQLAGTFAQVVTPIIKGLSDTLDKNAPIINRHLTELLQGISGWGTQKGKEFIDWIVKITDPANNEQREEWIKWFDQFKISSTAVAGDLKTISEFLANSVKFAQELARAMRDVKNALGAGGVEDIPKSEQDFNKAWGNGIPEEGKQGSGFWDRGGTRRFFRDLFRRSSTSAPQESENIPHGEGTFGSMWARLFGGGGVGSGGGGGGGGFEDGSGAKGGGDSGARGGDIGKGAGGIGPAGRQLGAELARGRGAAILDVISRAEGTRGYNDSFAHQLKMDLSTKNLNEIDQIQRGMHGSSAIGRYQFMRSTLSGLRGELGLSGEDRFTPAMQDRLARRLLQRRGYDRWRSGQISDSQFMNNLAQEWAGVTNASGRSVYAGVGLNSQTRSTVPLVTEALRRDRAGYEGAVYGGVQECAKRRKPKLDVAKTRAERCSNIN